MTTHGSVSEVLSAKAYKAADEGDLKHLQEFVAFGANLNNLDESGFTPLHIAAIKGHHDVLRYLVQQNVDLNARDSMGRTVLYDATVAEKFESVRLLVELGADANLSNQLGETPLHIAAVYGYIDLIKYLMKHSDIEARDQCNETALFKAVQQEYVEALRVLIANGADPYCKNYMNANLMHTAASYGRTSLVNELARYPELMNAEDSEKNTPLYYAIESNNPGIIRELIRRGAEIRREHLMKATEDKNVEIIKILEESVRNENLLR